MAKENKGTIPNDEALADAVGQKSITEIFEENKNTITYVLIGLLVAVAGYLLYRQLVKVPQEIEAVEQMASAQTQFERDSFALALTNPGAGYPGFVDIADQYSGTDAGNLALYYAGISYLQIGQFDAAIDYLKDFNPAGDITPAMKAGALGDAYSEKGDFDGALSAYEKAVSKSNNNLISAYYLMKLGMLNERQGNTEAAREAYETIQTDYYDTPQANDIEKYLVRVQG